MTLIERLNLTAAQKRWLGQELHRRAAACYAEAGRYRDAAESWEAAGEPDRAIQVLMQHEDMGQAARMLWERGRYREALACYEKWQAQAKDQETQVSAWLGMAACWQRLGTPERVKECYRRGRALVEGAESGRCWRMLGEYGVRVGRMDLVHVGYEEALRRVGMGWRGERRELLEEYLAAAVGNRLLTQRLREELAELGIKTRRREKISGEALKKAAEQIKEVHRFVGHTAQVRSVSFSPDGRMLASGSDDETIRLWDPATGRELRRLEGHTSAVHSVSFSPDGRWLASGGDDHTIRLWDPATGQELRRLEGHSGQVQSVCFSPDGRWLASGSEDNTVRLWDPATGRELRRLEGHTGSVWHVSFSPDGRWLASGAENQSIRLWNPATGQEVRQMEAHSDNVDAVSFSPDGQWLASGGTDGTIRLWNPATGQELRRYEGHTRYVWRVAFSPDGHLLASGGGDGTDRLWEISTGVCLTIIRREDSYVVEAVFSPDGRYFLSGDEIEQFRLFDVSALDLWPEEDPGGNQ